MRTLDIRGLVRYRVGVRSVEGDREGVHPFS